MLLSNEVTWKMYGLDRKERELESGSRWNNVSTAQSLLNILRNFSFHGIRLDDRFHYQLTLLYHHHWSLYKAEKDWRESMDPKHPHKFQVTTSYKIHVLSHNSVLRVSSVSKNPMTSYGLTTKHLPLSQPVLWGLQLAMLIVYTGYHLLLSRACYHEGKSIWSLWFPWQPIPFESKDQVENGKLMIAVIIEHFVLCSVIFLITRVLLLLLLLVTIYWVLTMGRLFS